MRAELVADPQPVPFVQFSKELLGALARSPMPATQLRIVLALIMRTYGDFGRKEAELSLGLLHELIGQDKGTLRRALHDLAQEGVVTVVRPATGRRPQMLALQKNYEAWGRYSVGAVGAPATVGGEATVGRRATLTVAAGPPFDGATVDAAATVTVAGRPPYGPATVGAAATTIDKSKSKTRAEKEQEPPLTPQGGSLELECVEELSGELVDEADSAFDDFWHAYPNRQAKPLAAKRWARLDELSRRRAVEVAAVMRESVRCGYRDAALCPHAATFLNQARYDDWYEAGALVVPPGYGPQVAVPRQSRNRDLIARVMQEDYA